MNRVVCSLLSCLGERGGRGVREERREEGKKRGEGRGGKEGINMRKEVEV